MLKKNNCKPITSIIMQENTILLLCGFYGLGQYWWVIPSFHVTGIFSMVLTFEGISLCVIDLSVGMHSLDEFKAHLDVQLQVGIVIYVLFLLLELIIH
jgi:hypothetical protein